MHPAGQGATPVGPAPAGIAWPETRADAAAWIPAMSAAKSVRSILGISCFSQRTMRLRSMWLITPSSRTRAGAFCTVTGDCGCCLPMSRVEVACRSCMFELGIKSCCLLLQYLIQSCARGGKRIVEDMCYEIRRASACVD
jgi:hypothetical protein